MAASVLVAGAAKLVLGVRLSVRAIASQPVALRLRAATSREVHWPSGNTN